jgi:hypothetical protein
MAFTVSVTPAENATVTVVSGSQKLCEVLVRASNGTGSCALTDNQLGLGLYSAQADTPAGSGFAGSSSDSVAFTILGLNILSAL